MMLKKIVALFAVAVLWAFSQSSFALCYTIPHTSSYLGAYYLQGFEGESTTCPQSNGSRWIEVCAKPANMPNASYSLCGSGYGVAGNAYTSLRFEYNTAYDFRVRYQKTDGTLGVVSYGSLSGVPNGNSGGGGGIGGGHPSCPPYNPNCTCAAGYPMGHPACDW